MKAETRAEIDQASKDWDQANEQCRVILNALQLVDVESPDWNTLFRGLCDEQAKRSAAGDRHAAAMRQSWTEFEEEAKAPFHAVCGHRLFPSFPACTLPAGHKDPCHRHHDPAICGVDP